MQLKSLVTLMVALCGAPLGGVALANETAHPSFPEGEAAYRALCSHCHGPALKNPGTSSFDLRQFPTDQPDRFVESVTFGRGDMAAFGDILLEGELDAIWVYIATRAGTQPFPEEAETSQ